VYEGVVKNNYLYQGAFALLDEDIQWTDFPLRNYDAQIGRWVQQDPYQQFASPYVGMGNDPVNLVDPSGGSILFCPGTSALAIFLDKAFTALIKASPIFGKISIGLNILKVAALITNMSETAAMINGQMVAKQVGYKVYQRTFAPWERFGNAFHPIRFRMVEYSGDSRGFSTSTNVTSRITLKYSIDLNQQNYQGEPSVYSDKSTMYKEGTNEKLDEKTSTPSYLKWAPQKTANTTIFKTRFEGSNPLFPFSPPIVWTGTLSITKVTGYIDVSYSFIRKGFPAFESFIEDGMGTKVFIGVYDAPAKGNAIQALSGSELAYASPTFRLRIYTNSNGSFSGNVMRTYDNGQSFIMTIST